MSEVPAPQRRRSSGDADSTTKAALLDAARACVADHGLAGTTSRLIARTAGANLASITYYFGSKDALIAEALIGEMSARIGPVLAVLEQHGEPAPSRLARALPMLIADFEDGRPELPVFLHALMASATPGPLGDAGTELLAALQVRLGAVIADLVSRRLVAPWVDPDSMAALLISTGYGIALHAHLQPDGVAVPALAGQLAALLMSAANPDPPPT